MDPRANPPAQAQKKKGGNGCLVALGIVGGLLLLFAILAGVVLWRVLRTDEAQAVIGAVGDATKAVKKGLNAPGTEELRKLGCEEAAVIDLADFMQIANRFIKDGGAVDPTKVDGRMVTCGLTAFQKDLTCDQVAKAYVAALGGRSDKPFSLTVQRQGHDRALCEVEYDEHGVPVRARAKPVEDEAASPER